MCLKLPLDCRNENPHHFPYSPSNIPQLTSERLVEQHLVNIEQHVLALLDARDRALVAQRHGEALPGADDPVEQPMLRLGVRGHAARVQPGLVEQMRLDLHENGLAGLPGRLVDLALDRLDDLGLELLGAAGARRRRAQGLLLLLQPRHYLVHALGSASNEREQKIVFF